MASGEQLKALIVGVDGQDGSYMAEHLIDRGLSVVGIGRRKAPHISADGGRFQYERCDLRDAEAVKALLAIHRPDRLYHLAAVHGASGYTYEDGWQDALAVNLGVVHLLLDYIRTTDQQARLLYASSLKSFRHPVTAHCCGRYATALRLPVFDYEKRSRRSDRLLPRRARRPSDRTLPVQPRIPSPSPQLLPRVTAMLAAAIQGRSGENSLASLDFACDWGSAREFMHLGAALLENEANRNYVMATGRTWTGAEFIDALFQTAGLDWSRHVKIRKPVGSEPVHFYQADISRMKAVLGRGPSIDALDVARWILRENHAIDLGSASSVVDTPIRPGRGDQT